VKLNVFEKLYINSPLHTLAQRRVVSFLSGLNQLQPGSRVVEIGCGRGVGMQLIIRAFQPASAEALDIDPRMIALTERRLRSPGNGRVAARVADVHELPYADGSIDAVFDFGVLHHLEEWERGLSEVARVLRPGGHFYIEEYFPALYANAFFGRIMRHPREDRFDGADFRSALAARRFRLLDGYVESKYRLIGVAVKEG
jgi:ubiquinone/menaquinone biosynthesis C-methylase UbiE